MLKPADVWHVILGDKFIAAETDFLRATGLARQNGGELFKVHEIEVPVDSEQNAAD